MYVCHLSQSKGPLFQSDVLQRLIQTFRLTIGTRLGSLLSSVLSDCPASVQPLHGLGIADGQDQRRFMHHDAVVDTRLGCVEVKRLVHRIGRLVFDHRDCAVLVSARAVRPRNPFVRQEQADDASPGLLSACIVVTDRSVVG